jgi:hypothetical protein
MESTGDLLLITKPSGFTLDQPVVHSTTGIRFFAERRRLESFFQVLDKKALPRAK